MNPDRIGRNGNSRGFQTTAMEAPDRYTLRRHLVACVDRSKLSVEDKVKALTDCVGQIETRGILEKVAGEAGLTLAHFLTNDALALFCVVKRDRHELGYVSKGWDEPGFRVGEVLGVPAFQGVGFIWTAAEIKRFCATNSIGVTFEQRGETTEVALDGVIYMEGFNQVTFLKALDALNTCVEKIEILTGNA